jgi:hypothetical protein
MTRRDRDRAKCTMMLVGVTIGGNHMDMPDGLTVRQSLKVGR